MPDLFRIHGDNIVECERFAKIIVDGARPNIYNEVLISPSTIAIEIEFDYNQATYSWRLELLPGFNKSNRHRWESDIFQVLRDNGSCLDETPDVIITKVIEENETILLAAEFCSALQAGNQAWQRSGRAFSTGRTGCPYLYIINFGNFEHNPNTRDRILPRFPNPAVPYSYINYSKIIENFVAQVYLRAEEFDKERIPSLAHFDENNFATSDLSAYIIKKMCGLDTNFEEQTMLQKIFNIVKFLAENVKPNKNFTPAQWSELNDSTDGIVDFSVNSPRFTFHKKIAAKSHHGKSVDFQDLLDDYSVGLASQDLPFGIIPSYNRYDFAQAVQNLYPQFSSQVIEKIGLDNGNLIICLLKGFKPGGDDNRPDRGALPLATMLSSVEMEIMTYIYGPILQRNYNLLLDAPIQLAERNGLWKSILALSNYIALDVPILNGNITDAEILIDNSTLKEQYTTIPATAHNLTGPVFSCTPLAYHEDDVDTGIHYTFARLLADLCFEGMCNPPGGDWSGISLIYNHFEKRWLSLPRVSEAIQGKRPDHVYEIWGAFDKPLLLAIESKEKSTDLELNVGTRLKTYIQYLMGFNPSVERSLNPNVGRWEESDSPLNYQDFVVLSAVAYLRSNSQPNNIIFNESNCDLLFIMDPSTPGWNIEIVPNEHNRNATLFKQFIYLKINDLDDPSITII